ncbi:MAG: ABC-F family ATP-binding cassette domain-containing protein [Anaerolineae bacterium]|nr:ABC-F family ATP-binding cassette domain-containing protein [Anaerolineae bacterium]
MSLIQATNLSKSYADQDIFSNLSLSIARRARIGLVGANGIGKTTLVRVLIGLEEPSSGSVQRARGLSMGYLPQEADFSSNKTLWEECLGAFEHLDRLQTELQRLEKAMTGASSDSALLEAYGNLQRQFEQQGGYTYEVRIEQTLYGLGFTRQDFERPVAQLSGGQRTRAHLAKLLLKDSDLLLLDEPTNHLDMAAIEWLETYLHDWQGAALIISHDRYFLDQVCTTIWEMTPALEIYNGNYSAYLSQRAQRYQRRLEEYQAQQALIEKEQEYIRRNIAGQNTRQAQGRKKRLERMLQEAQLTPPHETRRIHLHLEPAKRSGDLVIRSDQLYIGYQDEGRPLFSVPDLTLTRGECAAVIGPNGAGKTTFLKTLLGQLPPYSGEVLLGANLQIGYFAQAHEGLHPENTLMEEIETIAPQMRPAAIRDYLAKFLFTGDDVFKTVDLLSGGERSRLALAKLALQGANLLLLDEPTNHLDLPSQEILQTILADYRGTILLVSHDRYLIDALATQIWEIFPEAEKMNVFEGTYSEYKTFLQTADPASAPQIPVIKETPQQRIQKPEKPSKNQMQRKQQRLQSIENEITHLENQLALICRNLENPPADLAIVQKLGQEYQEIQTKLEKLYDQWAENSSN